MPAAKPKSARPKSAPRKTSAPHAALNSALAEASWTEADAALADALASADELATAADARAKEAALVLLQQALARVARKRGMSRVGELGAREAYLSARHDLNADSARAPKTVIVVGRGVVRGGETLAKVRAAPASAAKRK